jgi:hypothetical protein
VLLVAAPLLFLALTLLFFPPAFLFFPPQALAELIRLPTGLLCCLAAPVFFPAALVGLPPLAFFSGPLLRGVVPVTHRRVPDGTEARKGSAQAMIFDAVVLFSR